MQSACQEASVRFFSGLSYLEGERRKTHECLRRNKQIKGNVTPITSAQSKINPTTEIQAKEFTKIVEEASLAAFHHLVKSPGFQKMAAGHITIDEYRSIMREIYYYTRETPQMLGVLSSRLRGDQRVAVKMLFKHGLAEIGHDQMALQDAVALGEDAEKMEIGTPLPTTTALISYAYYQIDRLNPTGFLGFLYFLEFIANQGGADFIKQLKAAGVPDNALSFVQEHTEVDPAHNKLLGKYVEAMITRPEHLSSVLYCIKCTAELYGRMIGGAIEGANQQNESITFEEEKIERKGI